jgi:hypothetical protein
MKEMEFDVTITLNGCYKFMHYDEIGSKTEYIVLGHDIRRRATPQDLNQKVYIP